VTYWLLTQEVPFPSLTKKIDFIRGSIDFPLRPLLSKSITDEGMTFLQRAISVQPSERFTALIASDDPWLKDIEQLSSQASKSQKDALHSSGAPLDHPTDKDMSNETHRTDHLVFYDLTNEPHYLVTLSGSYWRHLTVDALYIYTKIYEACKDENENVSCK
jgi:serine/threonine protein kinase